MSSQGKQANVGADWTQAAPSHRPMLLTVVLLPAQTPLLDHGVENRGDAHHHVSRGEDL